MKKYVLLLSILVIFFGCEKDPTVELVPTITTGNVTDIQSYSAKIETLINDVSNVSVLGVIFDINSSFNSYPCYSSIYSFEKGNNKIYIDGLAFNKKYYCKAFAKDSKDNYVYGNVTSFTTLDVSISLVTGSAYSMGYNSSYSDHPYRFAVSASIVGIKYVTEWGIMAAFNSDFSPTGKSQITDNSYVEGKTYTQTDWGSTSSGLIYYRAYAILKDGSTIYGATKSVNVTY